MADQNLTVVTAIIAGFLLIQVIFTYAFPVCHKENEDSMRV